MLALIGLVLSLVLPSQVAAAPEPREVVVYAAGSLRDGI